MIPLFPSTCHPPEQECGARPLPESGRCGFPGPPGLPGARLAAPPASAPPPPPRTRTAPQTQRLPFATFVFKRMLAKEGSPWIRGVARRYQHRPESASREHGPLRHSHFSGAAPSGGRSPLLSSRPLAPVGGPRVRRPTFDPAHNPFESASVVCLCRGAELREALGRQAHALLHCEAELHASGRLSLVPGLRADCAGREQGRDDVPAAPGGSRQAWLCRQEGRLFGFPVADVTLPEESSVGRQTVPRPRDPRSAGLDMFPPAVARGPGPARGSSSAES